MTRFFIGNSRITFFVEQENQSLPSRIRRAQVYLKKQLRLEQQHILGEIEVQNVLRVSKPLPFSFARSGVPQVDGAIQRASVDQ